MHITKLRLLGFKSFVEPTELIIEQGLTGVVGPNGCGKSNLLEALRWCMGETSYKSMRASSMDDVIFNGTTQRPARNMAEVTMFIDNKARKAPAEFNDHEVLEVTRRIEREMGSAYRVNGRDTRARDIKILFEDAATGARSPALVRQGQISEIVNAKPEQRRRILEDAAGVAGLHSRRHEADLRLKAAEANLARIGDVIAQVMSQLESLKRQARQARRYKELTEEIKKGEALLHHVLWLAIEADIQTEEASLATALQAVASATLLESQLVTREHDAAAALPALRDDEAKAAAALHRIKIEQENFEREAIRAAKRLQELQDRSAQSKRDLQREEQLVKEARETLARLDQEKRDIDKANALAASSEEKAQAAFATAETAARNVEQRLSGLQTAAAEARARRNSLIAQAADRKEVATRIQRQVTALEAQLREITANAPDAAKLDDARLLSQTLQERADELEEALLASEESFETATADAARTREAAAQSVLKASQLKIEAETLVKLLRPVSGAAHESVLDQIAVETGFETALGAVLGEDLDAALDEDAPVHWRVTAAVDDPALPDGVTPLASVVQAPEALARRLAQIGVVKRADGVRLQKQLKPGQRLVSREGDVWRWDGLVATSHGASAAAQRLAERNRLDALIDAQAMAQQQADQLSADAKRAAELHTTTDAQLRRLRSEQRETQTQLATARDALAGLERAARDVEQRLSTITDTRDSASETLVEANERLADIEAQLEHLGETDMFEEQLTSAQEDAIERRQAVADARAEIATLEREHKARDARLAVIETDVERWSTRVTNADEQLEIIRERITAAEEEMLAASELPEQMEEQRGTLMTTLAKAENVRIAAADALAIADTAFREMQTQLRGAQAAVTTAREGKARLEARLEAARQRRLDHVRKTQEVVGVVPQDCLAVAEVLPEIGVPSLDEIEKKLTRAKADRERLGGVNLAAEQELEKAGEQFGGLDKERQDVEEAIAKLRGAINELNKEAKQRLTAAFEVVNGHFQHLFGILFNGGEARLQMIESETDPLEGGLEIIAKPPGKKPATLSLLSGGEQTLTALSLIFAVFLTNPSPICVLDEVDAPLDDANVDRFCTMMERMAADTTTRFLVITHHPQTMARMNRLFGVTMAEKGVSQLVSVDLELARSMVDESEAA